MLWYILWNKCCDFRDGTMWIAEMSIIILFQTIYSYVCDICCYWYFVIDIGLELQTISFPPNFDLIGSAGNHSAAVTYIIISIGGCMILSCSADRYVSIGSVYKKKRMDCVSFSAQLNNRNKSFT